LPYLFGGRATGVTAFCSSSEYGSQNSLGESLVYVFAHHLLGANLSSFPVRYVITLPGRNGSIIAFVAEFITAFVLMEVVLLASRHRRLARYTPLFVALVTVFYHTLLMSISGYSVNPARSFSSALFAYIWQGIWIYFIAWLRYVSRGNTVQKSRRRRSRLLRQGLP
jgi:aquaporin Z